MVVGDLQAGDQVQLFDSLSSDDEEDQEESQSLKFGTMGGGEMPQDRGERPSGGQMP